MSITPAFKPLLSKLRAVWSLYAANGEAISNKSDTTRNSENEKFLKIVKNITSKGFVRSNLEEKLVDLSDVRINLKTKN